MTIVLVAFVLLSALVLGLLIVAPTYAVIVLAALVGSVVALWALSSPVGAVSLLLATLFLRQVLPAAFGVDPFWLALAGVAAATGIYIWGNRGRVPRLGAVEVLIATYIAWNVFSLIQPHSYSTMPPPPSAPDPVWRFVALGTVLPLSMYVVGRIIFRSRQSVRFLIWTVVAYGAYSAVVSILQFHAAALVWPRYIVSDPEWVGRANGVPNQPVVNGLLLVCGYVAAVLVCSSRDVRKPQRVFCFAVILATSYGVYLTHTRAVWVAYFIVTLVGAVIMRRGRFYFVSALAIITALITIGWSTFISSDRERGGVTSANEIEDRLNLIATQIWAFKQEPLFGWGIGTFPTLNTYDHQQYSPSIPWIRGWAVSSHQNELGILAELGLIGLTLWLGILILLWVHLFRAIRSADPGPIEGRSYTLAAALMFLALILTGLTVDLRFFDFANALVMLVVGSAVGVAESKREGRPPPPNVADSTRRIFHSKELTL